MCICTYMYIVTIAVWSLEEHLSNMASVTYNSKLQGSKKEGNFSQQTIHGLWKHLLLERRMGHSLSWTWICSRLSHLPDLSVKCKPISPNCKWMILEDLCKSQPEVLNCFDFLQPYNKLMKIFLLKGLNYIVLKVLGKIPLTKFWVSRAWESEVCFSCSWQSLIIPYILWVVADWNNKVLFKGLGVCLCVYFAS